jgi:glycine hydroxymethyltransferase
VTPGGVRIGAPAMTTRKFVESDFEQIATFLDQTLKIALKIQEKSGPKLKDFVALLDGNEEVAALRLAVNKFATTFPMPGFDPTQMKYNTI